MRQLSIALLLAAGAAACGGGAQETAERAKPIAVTTTTAEVKDLPEAIEVGGTVRARTVAVLTSRIMGQVREILVEPGARVRSGEVLAVLDGREMDANRERAEALVVAASQGQNAAESDKAAADAALRLATATFQRVSTLREKKAATAQEFDEAQAALSAAEARAQAAAAAVLASRANATGARAALQGAQVASGYSRITAPFDGVVTQKQIDTGAMTMPGTPILTVERSGGLEVEIRIDDSRAARIDWEARPAVRLKGITTSDTEVELTGQVVERALALDAAHTVIAKIAIPESAGLRSGMFARVIFPGATRRALTVPVDSIVQRGQLDAVFVVEDGRARYRVIETGQRTSDAVEVRSGLVAGERVVRAVPASLADGVRVTGVSR
jgi:multidrug efflux pump subunit AcrA (membrane-fusion protein)